MLVALQPAEHHSSGTGVRTVPGTVPKAVRPETVSAFVGATSSVTCPLNPGSKPIEIVELGCGTTVYATSKSIRWNTC